MAGSTQTELEAELVEVIAALSEARKAVSLSSGDKTIARNYAMLVSERNQLEAQIQAMASDGGISFWGATYGGTS